MKVLIIDDDNFIREVYKSELNQENIEVGLAASGEDGLEMARKNSPDLILLDMILPGRSGFDVLGELKKDKRLKNTPVVVFSSLSQESDVNEAKELGCTMYLPKDSHSPKQIVEEIKKILSEL